MPKLDRSVILDASLKRAFDVVSDVESYPQFLPGCKTVRILESLNEDSVVEVVLSWAGFSDSFITKNHSVKEDYIRMELSEGPFYELSGVWNFEPIGDLGCRVGLELSYELKGIALVGRGLVERSVDRLVMAFEQKIQNAND